MSININSDPRIIPAYAGSTFLAYATSSSNGGSSPHTRGARPPPRRRRPRRRNHPRIRGEHDDVSININSDPRIIPAYAGSTYGLKILVEAIVGSSPHTRGAPSWRTRPRPRTGDHPRIRGEHVAPRGELARVLGIIPAYAGSTGVVGAWILGFEGSSPHTRGAPRASPYSLVSVRDHPRIRGEHSACRFRQSDTTGIIPAYAGSTVLGFTNLDDHSGSSPHTRGARTPTRRPPTSRRDHPRIRGEH